MSSVTILVTLLQKAFALSVQFLCISLCEGLRNLAVPCGGPYNKDYRLSLVKLLCSLPVLSRRTLGLLPSSFLFGVAIDPNIE